MPDIPFVEALCDNINIYSTFTMVCAFYRPTSASLEVFARLDDCISLHSRVNYKTNNWWGFQYAEHTLGQPNLNLCTFRGTP